MIKNRELVKPPKLKGYNFSAEEAREARDLEKLLTMRTETSLICNLGCRYCNSMSGVPPTGEISFEAIKDVISQVKGLGGKSVVVIGGGEPTIYRDFKGLISYINHLDLIPVLFTNTTTMTENLAKFLFDTNTSVITKLDSLDEGKQDFLAQRQGTYREIREGLDNLINVGFTDCDPFNLRLGVSFVATSLTLNETPNIWRFCRDNNIYPNQEELVPRGRALKELSGLTITNQQLHEVKSKLLEIDHIEYGYDWLVHMPLTGNGCLQHLYSIYLTSKGYVRPCADVDIDLFNVKEMKIVDILKTPFFQLARNIEGHLKGKCGSCEYTKECIGCRGIAYSTGRTEGLDPYEALKREDPLCYKK